jgi:phosphoribosylformylglycinamidine synthase
VTDFAVRVDVTHKEGILDPQGAAIERALPALGYGDVGEVSVGKVITLVITADDEATARAQVDEMCRRLLANPVIEDYVVLLTHLERA